MGRLFRSWLLRCLRQRCFCLPVCTHQILLFASNDVRGANSVAVFSVDSTTLALPNLGTTPAGGAACGQVYYASDRIVTSPNGNYLHVANGASDNITISLASTRRLGHSRLLVPAPSGIPGVVAGGLAVAACHLLSLRRVLPVRWELWQQ